MSAPKEILAAFPVPTRRLPVVYYLQRANGAIKIGTSTWLQQRKAQLEQVHGPLDLLIWEPGGRLLERRRHHEFWSSIVDRRYEWFRPEPDLLDHIAEIRTELDAWTAEHGERFLAVLR